MFISISYVCVFVQYHQMAIPAKHSPSIAALLECFPEQLSCRNEHVCLRGAGWPSGLGR